MGRLGPAGESTEGFYPLSKGRDCRGDPGENLNKHASVSQVCLSKLWPPLIGWCQGRGQYEVSHDITTYGFIVFLGLELKHK